MQFLGYVALATVLGICGTLLAGYVRRLLAWRRFARRHGMQPRLWTEHPSLHGEWRGVPVSVEIIRLPLGPRSWITNTCFEGLLERPMPTGLHISSNDVDRPDDDDGDKSIATGCSVTDRGGAGPRGAPPRGPARGGGRRSADPEGARRLLANEGMRRAIKAFIEHEPGAWVTDLAVHLNKPGFLADEGELQEAIGRVSELAGLLRAWRPS